MVIELDLHTHRADGRNEVGLIRKNEARSPGAQALLVAWNKPREDNLPSRTRITPQTPALVR